MRSLRLDPDLDERVQRAATVKGESVSEFIRHAAEEHGHRRIFTLDSDFHDYRIHGRQRNEVVPTR